ncbi:MAG: ABC transporter ATP-binding protein [Pseudomonadota bacterium]
MSTSATDWEFRKARTTIGTIWDLAGDQQRVLLQSIGFKALQAICEAAPVAVLVTVISALRTETFTHSSLLVAVAIVLCCVAGQWVASYFANRSAWIATFELFARLRARLLNRVRCIPMSAHDRLASGHLTTVMTQDVSAVETFTHEPLQQMIGATVAPFVVFVVLSLTDFPMAVATMLSVVLAFPVFLWTNRVFRTLAIKRQDLQADAASRMIEYVQGLAVVRAFGVAGSKLNQFRDSLAQFKAISDEMVRRLAPLSTLFLSTVFLGIPLVLFVGSYWLLGGKLDGAVFLIFAILALRVYLPLVAAAEGFESMRMADASLDRIAAVFAEPVQQPVVETERPSDFSVRFEQLWFAYDEDKPLLKDLSFTAEAGAVTALVGPSGSGKSTVLQLVAGLRIPHRGHILFGGVEQQSLSQRQLFDAVTPVFQDVYLFPGTIFDNIAFGQPGADATAVQRAAKLAQAHEFIERLPQGYETIVQEAGQNLSGGERQRVTIARAILKDSPIVLLDEVTSALDATNERLVQEGLAALVRNKTVLVVAHRLATIRSADQIIVLDQGRIVQRGRHEGLIEERDGLYRSLWASKERAAAWRVR